MNENQPPIAAVKDIQPAIVDERGSILGGQPVLHEVGAYVFELAYVFEQV